MSNEHLKSTDHMSTRAAEYGVKRSKKMLEAKAAAIYQENKAA